jgi:hypothetical protein
MSLFFAFFEQRFFKARMYCLGVETPLMQEELKD